MEKDRGYYSLGILADQGAPWLARPQPNSLAQLNDLWGSPCYQAWPERVQSVRGAWPVHTGVWSLWPNAILGAVISCSSTTEVWNHWQEDGVGSSAITLLHQNLHEQDRKGDLTEAAVSPVVTLDIGKESNVEGVRDGVLLLHKQEEDITNQCRHLVGNEQHGGE
jgi:hypothetical protein